MAVTAKTSTPPARAAAEAEPTYLHSPAHAESATTPTRLPPGPPGGALRQSIIFVRDPFGFALANHGRYGEVMAMRLVTRPEALVAISHPDHIKSVFTAPPADMPSITGQSPLRPIVGSNSVLTLVGDEHLRHRKLLLPPFHGDAVARYVAMIEQVTAAEIDRWKPGRTFRLAPRMQALTLEVIMRGVLGIERKGGWNTHERRFREAIRFCLNLSNSSVYPLVELLNARRTEPTGPLKWFVQTVDRELYPLIRERRAQAADPGRHDVFSLLLAARDEQGEPLSTAELRDELISLILAGHETTANSLAWTFERLVRNPDAYSKLRDVVRNGSEQQADAHVEATIYEGMRTRPVIAFTARLAKRPWRFGEYVVPAGTPIAVSIVGVHHRPDIYPEPHRFRPQRFLDADGNFVKPGTYCWIPFGGGIRRCLGAALAMAEQRVVLREIARRVDFELTDAPGERPQGRNVTTIPSKGGRVTVAARR